MKRTSLFLSPCLLLAIVFTSCAPQTTGIRVPTDIISGFPTPRFTAQADAPDWLLMAVQFHGHLGPGLVFSCLVGKAGLEAVGAQGYFDVEVTAYGPLAEPPQSCVLDGLQLATGATLGKRNINIVESEEYVFVIRNRRTEATVEIRPTPFVLELLPPFSTDNLPAGEPQDLMQHAETVGRKMLGMSRDELMVITSIP